MDKKTHAFLNGFIFFRALYAPRYTTFTRYSSPPSRYSCWLYQFRTHRAHAVCCFLPTSATACVCVYFRVHTHTLVLSGKSARAGGRRRQKMRKAVHEERNSVGERDKGLVNQRFARESVKIFFSPLNHAGDSRVFLDRRIYSATKLRTSCCYSCYLLSGGLYERAHDCYCQRL